MLVLDMIYLDWIVQKGEIYRYLWDVSHALDPFGFEALQVVACVPFGKNFGIFNSLISLDILFEE